MKRYVILAVLAASVFSVSPASFADTIFMEDFSTVQNTPLHGLLPSVGGAWNIKYGGEPLVNRAMDTYDAGSSGIGAFASFTQALGPGQTLDLTFDTLQGQGNFFTDWGNGYAGISLFVGDNELVFLGKPGYTTGWGTDGSIGQHTLSSGKEAEHVRFTYAYDTGAWDFTVGIYGTSGTTDTHLAFDQLRVGCSDNASLPCDIKLSGLQVTTSIPEPNIAALFLMGALGCGWYRAKKLDSPRRYTGQCAMG